MNKAVYKHIFQTYGRNPGQWVGVLAYTVRTFIIRVYTVVLVAQVTSSIASGDTNAAKKQILYFLIAYIAGSVIGTLGELLSVHTENKQYGHLMMIFYEKLINKDISFYRDNQTGYLSGAYRQYLDSVLQLVRFFRGEALATLIALVVPPIVLFIASPTVGLVAIGIVVIQLIYVMWVSSKANKYREISHEMYRKVTGEVSDVITNIIAFKAGGVEDQAHSKMVQYMKEETEAFNLRRRQSSLLDLPRSIVTGFGVTLAVYVIIINTSGLNPESLGLMILTITYMFQIVRNVGALPELILQHDDLVTKAYPTLQYLGNDYEKVRDPQNPVKLNIKNATIDIDHVGFSYAVSGEKEAKIPVFHDLTVKIKSGEHIGVVGLSGAGKSTLANLLLRFDEIDSGSIKIDGIDIRDVKQSDLRRNIAYVPQEPLLFHRTVKENIAYYNSTQSSADIISSAKAAHAHEFIENLPHGYDTVVGERGIKLSGGQKQRIAIARAILKKAPILIFDEATSALDSESEQIIQRALPEIIGTQTAIVVAHRLSTIAGLDRIIVLHEGNIIESGTHEELLTLKGRYYSLWQKQTREFATVPQK